MTVVMDADVLVGAVAWLWWFVASETVSPST